jgi:hypothetical protein
VVRLVLAAALIYNLAGAQVIEFESGGLRYQALTRNGLTIMFAELPAQIREYSVLQVAVTNGSRNTYTIRPEDFILVQADGSELPAVPARTVVDNLIERASRNDVIRLVTVYENTLYGNTRYKATNGYEVRRQHALAEVQSTKIKAAAAASAIALVQTKLAPGEATDGAIFYATHGRPVGPGILRVRAAGAVFEFPVLTSTIHQSRSQP